MSVYPEETSLLGLKIGFAITGSFCTFNKVIPLVKELVESGADVYPVLSESVARFDTRYFKADEFRAEIESITGKKAITTIVEAEPIGPGALFDIIIVSPCTGNPLAKIACAITDTSVTMAVKEHLRTNKPVLIAVSTNDGLSNNAKNLGLLLNMNNICFVPFSQDEPLKKINSIVARYDLLVPALPQALKGQQIEPLMYNV